MLAPLTNRGNNMAVSSGNYTVRLMNNRVIAWVALLGGVYILRDVLRLPVPEILFTTICLLSFLSLDSGDALGVYIFSSILTLPGFEIRFAYILVFISKFLLSGRFKIHSFGLVVFSATMILQLLNMFIFSSKSISETVYTFVEIMLYFAIPLIWLSSSFSQRNLQQAVSCFVAGVLLVSMITIIMTVQSRSWEIVFSSKNRIGMGLRNYYSNTSSMFTSFNTNALARFSSLVTSMIVVLIDSKKIRKLPGILIISFCIFIVLMTKSRTGLLSLALLAMFYIMVLVVKKKAYKNVLFSLLLLAVIYVVVQQFIPNVWNAVLDRFITPEDITNGRIDLNSQYLHEWKNSLWSVFLGYGVQSYSEVVMISNSPHNMIVDILISWGLLGLILIIFWIIMFARLSRKNLKNDVVPLAFLPVVVYLFGVMAGQYVTVPLVHLHLCFTIMSIAAFAEELGNVRLQSGVV